MTPAEKEGTMPGIWWDNESEDKTNHVTFTDFFLLDVSKPPTQAYLDWCRRTRPDWDLSELSWRVWIGRLEHQR